jgi:hypothetical protein
MQLYKLTFEGCEAWRLFFTPKWALDVRSTATLTVHKVCGLQKSAYNAQVKLLTLIPTIGVN